MGVATVVAVAMTAAAGVFLLDTRAPASGTDVATAPRVPQQPEAFSGAGGSTVSLDPIAARQPGAAPSSATPPGRPSPRRSGPSPKLRLEASSPRGESLIGGEAFAPGSEGASPAPRGTRSSASSSTGGSASASPRGAAGRPNSAAPGRLSPGSAARAQNPEEADLTQPGSIAVRVTGVEAEPIPQALVRITDEAAVAPPLEDVTDGEGMAGFRNLRRDRQLRIEAAAPGLVPGVIELPVGWADGATLSLQLLPAAVISGRLRDEQGQGVGQVELSFIVDEELVSAGLSAADGFFELTPPPGLVGQLRIDKRGYQSQLIGPIESGSEGLDISLVSEAVSELTLRLTAPPGAALPEQVRLDGELLPVDREGRVRLLLPVLAPVRSVELILEAEGFRPLRWRVTSRGQAIDLGENPLESARSFYGELVEVDAEGELRPIPEMVISSPEVPGVEVATDAEGRFELPGVPPVFTLWIRGDEHHSSHSQRFEQSRPEAPGWSPNSRARLILSRGRLNLFVRVLDPSGQPLANARVTFLAQERITDGAGIAQLTELSRPVGRLEVAHEDFLTVQRSDLNATPDDPPPLHTIRLERGTIIRGALNTPSGAPVTQVGIILTPQESWDEALEGPKPGARSVATDESGVFRFEAAPPGPYELRIAGSSQPPRALRLEPEQRLDILLEP